MRHTDANPGWIKREFAAIRRQMREDRAAKKLQAATIGKGGVTIKQGGFLSARYPASLGGGEATRFGPLLASESDVPGYAIQVKDETGTILFTAVRNIPTVDAPAGSSGVFAEATLVSLAAGAATLNMFDGLGSSFEDPLSLLLSGGTGGVQIVHSTTGASANCFIDPSDSRIWRSTSSRRYKQDIEDAEVDPAAVLNMRGVTFRDKGQVEADPDTETRYVGFIAEELHDLGLTQFVDYDGEGRPDAIAYDRLTVALLAVLKDQQGRIEALELANEAPAEA